MTIATVIVVSIVLSGLFFLYRRFINKRRVEKRIKRIQNIFQ